MHAAWTGPRRTDERDKERRVVVRLLSPLRGVLAGRCGRRRRRRNSRRRRRLLLGLLSLVGSRGGRLRIAHHGRRLGGCCRRGCGPRCRRCGACGNKHEHGESEARPGRAQALSQQRWASAQCTRAGRCPLTCRRRRRRRSRVGTWLACTRRRRPASGPDRGRHGLRLDVFRGRAPLAVRIKQQNLPRRTSHVSNECERSKTGGASGYCSWCKTRQRSRTAATAAPPATAALCGNPCSCRTLRVVPDMGCCASRTGQRAHPLVPADGEALAGNRLAVPDSLHQAVADDGVLVLSCAGSCHAGYTRVPAGSSPRLLPRRLGASTAPVIVSVTVRELDFLSSFAARLVWLAGTATPWPPPGAAMWCGRCPKRCNSPP